MSRTLLIRHTHTKAKTAEVVRSTNDIPIDEHGMQEAMNTGRKLRDIPIDKMITSDMSRAHDTAKIVSSLNTNHPRVVQTAKLNPINWGTFTGKKVEKVQDQLNEYLRNPNKKIPGGGTVQKTVNDARAIILPAIDNGTNIAIVMHNSHFRALPHILNPKKSLVRNDDIVPPGGVIELIKNGNEIKMRKL